MKSIETYQEAYAAYGDKAIPMAVAMNLPLYAGGGNRDKGICIMQMVAWLGGERNTDHPACASNVITSYAIELNDLSLSSVRDSLRARASKMVGTSNNMLERARVFVLLQSVVASMNEAFTFVEGNDRVELADFVERINAVILEPKNAIDATFPKTPNLWGNLAPAKGQYTDLVKVFAYMLDSDGFDTGTGIVLMRVADEVFSTSWQANADPDTTKPQPGARALVALDAMIAVDRPL